MNDKVKRTVRTVAGYVACVLACTYGAEPAAPQVAKIIYRSTSYFTRFDPSGVLTFYTQNWLIFNLVSGLACGCAVYSVWRNAATVFVWIPSAAILCQKIALHKSSVMEPSGSAIRYYLSIGCSDLMPQSFHISPRCWDQVRYSLPFYASLGFSLGSFLLMLYWRRKGIKNVEGHVHAS